MTPGKSKIISGEGQFFSGPERLVAAAADSRRRSYNDVQLSMGIFMGEQ